MISSGLVESARIRARSALSSQSSHPVDTLAHLHDLARAVIVLCEALDRHDATLEELLDREPQEAVR